MSAIAVAGCDDSTDAPSPGDPSVGPSSSIEHLSRSAPLPPSTNHSIALLAERVACIVDSYAVRVECGPPDGSNWSTVNSGVGEGPGELRSVLSLVRVDTVTVGAYDYRNGRMSYFSVDGAEVESISVPSFGAPFPSLWEGAAVLLPMRRTRVDDGEVLELTWVVGPGYPDESLDPSGGDESPSGFARPGRLGPIPDGAPVLSHRSAVPTSPLRLRNGDILLHAFDGVLLRLGPTGAAARLISLPDRPPEPLNERDIEARIASYRNVFGSEMPTGRVRSLRTRIKSPVMGDQAIREDGWGRVWIATTRDRDRYSYFEVMKRDRFEEAVRVSDRMLGYDIRGSLLAVLVEGPEPDAAGIHPRFLDLYRILPPANVS